VAANLAWWKDPARLRAFIGNHGIGYKVLLGCEPSELTHKLPQAINLNTWPPTFFVGRDGLVRGASAGFAGNASGEEHARLKEEFEHKIESLLSETVPPSR
jgi:hypothetical protein